MKNYQIIFAEEAKQDLINIQNYIFEDSQNLAIADNFVLDLFQAVKSSLATFPHKHPIYKRNIRKFVFPRHTNYSAYFKINEQQDSLVVLAITENKQFTRYMNL